MRTGRMLSDFVLKFDDAGSGRMDESAKYQAKGDSSPFFLKQVDALGDACGTVAVVHGMLNHPEIMSPGEYI
jgi:alpha-beta hydrolase superfamily lysophospholipase